MSSMTRYKYITYYMAHNGRSTIYPQIAAKVNELYPKNSEGQRMAISLALYHSGRCCHVQGYFRWYMKDLDGNSVEGQTSEETRALLDEDCRKLVAMYDPTTITCWYSAIRNHDSSLALGMRKHAEHAAKRKANAIKAKKFNEGFSLVS